MTECSFKVLVVGDTKVGKTSMVMRYTSNKWLGNSVKPTIGGEGLAAGRGFVAWAPLAPGGLDALSRCFGKGAHKHEAFPAVYLLVSLRARTYISYCCDVRP